MGDNRVRRGAKDEPHIVLDGVSILLQPVGHCVGHGGRVVFDDEGVARGLLFIKEEALAVAVGLVNLLEELQIGTFSQRTLLVKQRDDAAGAGDQPQAGLVVGALNVRHVDPLRAALGHVAVEDIRIVMVL